MAKYSLPSIAFFIVLAVGCNNQQQSKNLHSEDSKSVVSDKVDTRVKQNPLRDVNWGDTHNHTRNSFDVCLFGTPNPKPEITYRFARGEEVESLTAGKYWQLSKPLDSLVVAGHA